MTTLVTARCQILGLVLALGLHQAPLMAADIMVAGACTLVDAINAANNDDDAGGRCPPGGSGKDTLYLTGDVTLMEVDNAINGASGLPPVSTDIVIEGGGFTIARAENAPSFRIVQVANEATLWLNEVTLRNGFADRGPWPAGGSSGGAISFRQANGHLSHVSIIGNRADSWGGGIFVVDGVLEVDHTTIADNVGEVGGGIRSIESSVRIDSSTISGNVSDRNGGGFHSDGVGDITVTNSTVSGNVANRAGGGLYSSHFGTGTEVHITNTTFFGNAAPRPRGSALANTGGEDVVFVFLRNTIISGNTRWACDGGFMNEGGNLIGGDPGRCRGEALAEPGIDFDTALRDNGGPTATHALFPGSSAIDLGGDCGLETDQRGAFRDTACDSGAFELAPIVGACCVAPNSQRICVENMTQEACELQRGLYVGDATHCDDPLSCETLLVTMDSMSATATNAGVDVQWTTAVELDTVAFRVLREGGRREKALHFVVQVAAGGNDLRGHTYTVSDDAPEAIRATRYFIEDIDVWGKVTQHGPILVGRSRRETGAGRTR